MISEPAIITPQKLRKLAMCHRRVWLDQHGDLSQHENIDPNAPPFHNMDDTLRTNVTYSVKDGQFQKTAIDSWAHGILVTQNLIHQAADEVHHAHLEITIPLDLSDRLYTLRGIIDRLQRIQVQGQTIYSPILITQQRSPEEADWLHLDYYVWLLQLDFIHSVDKRGRAR